MSSTTIMEEGLLKSLRSDPDLARRGCVATPLTPGGVAIEVHGQRRGQWAWRAGAFGYTRTDATAADIVVETIAEALHYTRITIAPGD